MPYGGKKGRAVQGTGRCRALWWAVKEPRLWLALREAVHTVDGWRTDPVCKMVLPPWCEADVRSGKRVFYDSGHQTAHA